MLFFEKYPNSTKTSVFETVFQQKWRASSSACGGKHSFFDNKSNNEVESDKKPTYGFKSGHCSPQYKALILFENDMYDFANNIRYCKTGNEFQKHLNEDIRRTKQSESLYVTADKTTNIQKVKPDDYNKLLNDNHSGL